MSREEIQKLAALARLRLTDEEVTLFCPEISKILDYIDIMNSVNTEGLTPTYQIANPSSIVRADVLYDYGVKGSDLLKGAPDTESNFLKVKRMIG